MNAQYQDALMSRIESARRKVKGYAKRCRYCDLSMLLLIRSVRSSFVARRAVISNYSKTDHQDSAKREINIHYVPLKWYSFACLPSRHSWEHKRKWRSNNAAKHATFAASATFFVQVWRWHDKQVSEREREREREMHREIIGHRTASTTVRAASDRG